MYNELIFFAMLFVSLAFVLFSYRFFRETGLIVMVVVLSILSNIQVMKSAVLFGFPVVLSGAAFGGIFLATDILSEHYGKKSASQSVLISIMVTVFFNISFQLFLLIEPTAGSVAMQDALNSIFSLFLPVAVASLVTFYASQSTDILIFDLIKKMTGDKHAWLRNNGSTIVSQTVDTLVFIGLLAFMGIFTDNFWSGIAGLILVKIIVALIDTPFFYLARLMKKKGRISEDLIAIETV